MKMPEKVSTHLAPILTPQKLVETLARRKGSSYKNLTLPATAVITPVYPIFRHLVRLLDGKPLKSWSWKNPSPFRFGGRNRDRGVVACCPMGAPNVAMILEEFAAFGVETVLFLGLAGGIENNTKIGNLVLPPYAHVGEGTSRYYGNPSLTFADKVLWQELKSGLVEEGVKDIMAFPIWTTDALYRETRGMLKELTGLRVMGVDMETSAVFSVAKMLSIRAAVILWISDILGPEGWEPHFHEERLKWAIVSHMKALKRWLFRSFLSVLPDGKGNRS